jgi:hypothetical protein
MVIGDGIIGAFGNAGLTAGAQVGVHNHNAVIALADGLIRTNLGAGGIVAMTAQVHLEAEFQFVINPPGTVLFNVYQLDTLRGPILLFAGHLTGLAAPAEVMVYTNFKLFHNSILYADHEPSKKIRIPNFEIRNKFEYQMTKIQNKMWL